MLADQLAIVVPQLDQRLVYLPDPAAGAGQLSEPILFADPDLEPGAIVKQHVEAEDIVDFFSQVTLFLR